MQTKYYSDSQCGDVTRSVLDVKPNGSGTIMLQPDDLRMWLFIMYINI